MIKKYIFFKMILTFYYLLSYVIFQNFYTCRVNNLDKLFWLDTFIESTSINTVISYGNVFISSNCLFLNDCSDCDCVRQYKTISGWYGLNMNGTLVFVLCEFETNQTWTVRHFLSTIHGSKTLIDCVFSGAYYFHGTKRNYLPVIVPLY